MYVTSHNASDLLSYDHNGMQKLLWITVVKGDDSRERGTVSCMYVDPSYDVKLSATVPVQFLHFSVLCCLPLPSDKVHTRTIFLFLDNAESNKYERNMKSSTYYYCM